MLTIICGEDSIASRNYFLYLQEEYKKKSYEIKYIPSKNILDEIEEGQQAASLFNQNIIYFTEELSSHLSRAGKNVLLYFEKLSSSKQVDIVDWEPDKSARDLKISKLGKLKEFKPQNNIFKLLDECAPGKKQQFITILRNITSNSNAILIHIMLSRHIRSLILAKEGSFSSKVFPWQKSKLTTQAKLWDSNKLIKFYEGLIKIDENIKTSAVPFGVRESLEILACYFL